MNTALYVVDYKGNDPQFIAFFLRQQLKNYQSDKAAVPGVDRKVLHKLPARCPDPQIQRAIVRTLSAYDSLIENNQRRIALLEEAARQLYKEWFVRFRFPGHEDTRIIDGLPVGWERRTISELTTKLGSGATPLGGSASYQDIGITLIRSQNVYDFRFEDDGLVHITDNQADKLTNVTVHSGDILLNITVAST